MVAVQLLLIGGVAKLLVTVQVAGIPDSKFSDWNHIDISLGLIYADTDTRRNLAQLKDYIDVQII